MDVGVEEVWSSLAESIQNIPFLEGAGGRVGEIGHGLSPVSFNARIYTWKRSAAEVPCSLGYFQVQIQH